MRIHKPFLAMTITLLVLSQAADAFSVLWEHDGTDSEWNSADNWVDGVLPGTERIDIAVFAGPQDRGEVTTAVHSRFPVDLTMRNGALLVIGADVENLRNVRISSSTGMGTTTLLHTAGTVTSSGFLNLGEAEYAVYGISGTSVLSLAEEIIIFDFGVFSLGGSSASVSSGLLGFSIEGAGELEFTFDASGIGTITTAGSFSVDRAESRLTIDASEFQGSGSFDLVTYDSLEGRGFAESNVSITGLGAERTGSITYDTHRMNLDIKVKPGAKGHYVDIPEPETYPLFVGFVVMAYVAVCGRRR